MFVYIAHAEADQADADELKTFLSSRGLVVHTETGARGFAHLQPSDVVVALWSRNSTMASHRLEIERRMLDAWADERLVLVRLGNAIMPVGLRDLPFIDASFENGRALAVWPQVERAAKDAMNRALVERERSVAEVKAAGSGRAPGLEASMRPAPSIGDKAQMDGFRGGGPARAPTKIEIDDEVVAAPKRRGFPVSIIFMVLAFGLLAWTGSELASAGWDLSNITPNTTRALGFAGLSVLVILVTLVRFILGGKTRKAAPAEDHEPPMPTRISNRKRAEAPAASAAAAPAPQPAAPPAPAALFISYAHADNAAVEPVVAVVTASGRTVWIDKAINPGEGWAGEIVRAIKGAKGIIVMCSKHAFESDHVKREVYLADRYKKPMSPVFLEDVPPPEDFEYFFASVQWLELWKLPEADRPAAIGKALEAV